MSNVLAARRASPNDSPSTSPSGDGAFWRWDASGEDEVVAACADRGCRAGHCGVRRETGRQLGYLKARAGTAGGEERWCGVFRSGRPVAYLHGYLLPCKPRKRNRPFHSEVSTDSWLKINDNKFWRWDAPAADRPTGVGARVKAARLVVRGRGRPSSPGKTVLGGPPQPSATPSGERPRERLSRADRRGRWPGAQRHGHLAGPGR